MKEYISSQTVRFIKEEDRSSFFEEAVQDLKEIDLSRIAVLGITPNQINACIVSVSRTGGRG